MIKRIIAACLALASCGRSSSPEIRAERYEPGVPDGVKWRSESTIIGYPPGDWGVSEIGQLMTLTKDPTYVVVPLTPPDDSSLACVSFMWYGAGGHAHLPEVMPTIVVRATNLESVELLDLGSAVDASSTIVDYQQTHVVEGCFEPVKIDNSRFRYHATIHAENDANAISGAYLFGVRHGVL